MNKVTHYFFSGLLCLCLTMTSGISVAGSPQFDDDQKQFQQAMDLTRQGKWMKAADIFSQIAKNNPAWPEPKNNLAVALLRMGQLDQAKQALEDAVMSRPSYKVAQQNRQRLYDHLAAQAYGKALGETKNLQLPELALLDQIELQSVVTRTSDANDQTQALLPLSQQLKTRVQNWSTAWSASNVTRYLSFYSTQFRPDNVSLSYETWRKQRSYRLSYAKKSQVTLDNVQVYVNDDQTQAVVEFVQNYQSLNYTDKVVKQLVLSMEDNHWLILSERVIQQF